MPTPPLSTWKQKFSEIKPSDKPNGINLANWLDGLTTNQLIANGTVGDQHFTFNKGIFGNLINAAVPTPDPASAAAYISTSWATAIASSTYVPSPGVSVGAPTPATTFSTVVGLIDPTSVPQAQLILLKALLSARPTDNANDSAFSKAFRDAFLSLRFTLTGLNSAPTPVPLVFIGPAI